MKLFISQTPSDLCTICLDRNGSETETLFEVNTDCLIAFTELRPCKKCHIVCLVYIVDSPVYLIENVISPYQVTICSNLESQISFYVAQ